jgi:DNA repair exonuclease SbcCD ATPase subunit
MKIHEFSFRNICSYGNRLQTFTFKDEPQLILIQGENGSGKSSISDALTVSIYGKSAIRKTKEIPNRINRNAYTQIKFKTNSGKIVEIERGIDMYDGKILSSFFN